MDRVFIYWDNSNIFHEAQRLAEEQDEGPGARYRVRIHFENLLRLAHANRPLQKAVVAGSVPPEMRQLWNRMESAGIEAHLFDRGAVHRGEQEMPDRVLQLRMLEDALDFNGDPGIVVLLTGDGAGYLEGTGFHSTLERMHKRGWRVEILSWAHSTNQRMRRWAEANGIFVALDDFYRAITFMNPSRPGFELAQEREAAKLDLLNRRVSRPRHVQREPRPQYNVVEISSESELLAELTPETAHADELAHPMSIQGDRQTGETKQALAGFGMWKDHAQVQDVDACVSEMRKPRGAR